MRDNNNTPVPILENLMKTFAIDNRTSGYTKSHSIYHTDQHLLLWFPYAPLLDQDESVQTAIVYYRLDSDNVPLASRKGRIVLS